MRERFACREWLIQRRRVSERLTSAAAQDSQHQMAGMRIGIHAFSQQTLEKLTDLGDNLPPVACPLPRGARFESIAMAHDSKAHGSCARCQNTLQKKAWAVVYEPVAHTPTCLAYCLRLPTTIPTLLRNRCSCLILWYSSSVLFVYGCKC